MDVVVERLNKDSYMDSVIERPQLNEAIAAGLQTFPAIVQRLYHHRGIASLDQVNHAMKVWHRIMR